MVACKGSVLNPWQEFLGRTGPSFEMFSKLSQHAESETGTDVSNKIPCSTLQSQCQHTEKVLKGVQKIVLFCQENSCQGFKTGTLMSMEENKPQTDC